MTNTTSLLLIHLKPSLPSPPNLPSPIVSSTFAFPSIPVSVPASQITGEQHQSRESITIECYSELKFKLYSSYSDLFTLYSGKIFFSTISLHYWYRQYQLGGAWIADWWKEKHCSTHSGENENWKAHQIFCSAWEMYK